MNRDTTSTPTDKTISNRSEFTWWKFQAESNSLATSKTQEPLTLKAKKSLIFTTPSNSQTSKKTKPSTLKWQAKKWPTFPSRFNRWKKLKKSGGTERMEIEESFTMKSPFLKTYPTNLPCNPMKKLYTKFTPNSKSFTYKWAHYCLWTSAWLKTLQSHHSRQTVKWKKNSQKDSSKRWD